MTASVTSPGPYPSVLEAIEQPRIVRLEEDLYAAVFSLMKLVPARHMIDQARAAGALSPGAMVIETSSGTLGLGLALVCRLRGHPLIVVGDPAIDPALRRRLEMLGARVEIVNRFDAPGGIQSARLERVAELQRQHPGSFVPDQYNTPHNPGGYPPVADLLRTTVGRVTRLVGPVGSGGSTGGIAAALRAAGDGTSLSGVDTPGSVIFGHGDRPRLLRGLGSSIHPGNVDHRAYDDVHWVGAASAFHTTRLLYADKGLFVGPTSGAAYLVARWQQQTSDPGGATVVLFPDDGHRYVDTVYSDEWMDGEGLWSVDVPPAPHPVQHPDQVGGEWCWMRWRRRSLPDVLDAGTGT